MLLDDIDPNWTYRFSPEFHSGEHKLPLTQQDLECLSAFPHVPSDYLALYVEFGGVEFIVPATGFNLDLRSPLDAHAYYFDDGRSEYLPGMYPMTGSPASRTLCYGTIGERRGVYLFWDNDTHLSDGIYIAPTLFDLIFKGVGFEVIAQC